MINISIDVAQHELLTLNQRLHWAPKAKRNQLLRGRATIAWLRTGLPTQEGPLYCEAWITYPDHRRRDIHNLMPTVKAIIDGLVNGPSNWPKTKPFAGILSDDSDEHLCGPLLIPAGVRRGKGFLFDLCFMPLPKEKP